MHKHICPSPIIRFTVLLSVIMIISGITVAQPKFRIPITITDSSATLYSATAYFGFHPNATNCLDFIDTLKGFTDHWADIFVFGTPYTPDCIEYDAPPLGFSVDIRVRSYTPVQCRDNYLLNIHPYLSPSQVDSFDVFAQGNDASTPNPLIYTVPSVVGEYFDSLVISGLVPDDPVPLSVRVNLAATNGRYTSYPTATFDLLKRFKLYAYHPKNPPPPPSQVQLVSPIDAATNQSLNPTLTWNAMPLAQRYKYQIANDPSFSNVIKEDTASGTSKQVTGLQPVSTYYWRVAVITPYGMSYYQNPGWQFTTGLVSSIGGNPPTLAKEFTLSQNYPNPFNPSTKIEYALPHSGYVRLTVYNLFGQEVRTLVQGIQDAGFKSVTFDASNLPSGIYLYKLTAGSFVSVRKMAVIK